MAEYVPGVGVVGAGPSPQLTNEHAVTIAKLEAEVERLEDLLAVKNGLINTHQCIPRVATLSAKIEALEDVLASIDGPIGMTAEAFIEGKLKELKAGAENE